VLHLSQLRTFPASAAQGGGGGTKTKPNPLFQTHTFPLLSGYTGLFPYSLFVLAPVGKSFFASRAFFSQKHKKGAVFDKKLGT
jgi:hypothetical protein